MNQARQGDVFLRRVDQLPAKVKKLNTNVIAYGEVTGHAHKVEVDAGGGVTLVEDEQGNMFVCVKGNASMVHDEHGQINLTEGVYGVTIQREYDPVKERKVQD